MRKIFNGSYKKLNDDVSFQILRTNPRLTTNTKLMYDGTNLYMESYNANELLSTTKYKHKKIWKSGLYNNDIKNFLNGLGSSAYAVGEKLQNTIIGNNYSNQFENMYWCGCEEVSSKLYDEEFGIISPLYIRKKIPNYFIIFKVDGPTNEYSTDSSNFDFKNNILNKCRIVKSFSLKEGTPIGDYIRKYTSQLSFDYDKSIYVNYATNEIYYYGIDINSGLMTRKVENFKEELTLNDNTVIHSDDWITNGFYRNGLIFPYIMNIEFLFNDSETSDYKFCRYFGCYCDDIDLYEIEDIDSEIIPVNRNNIYYVKDKYNEIYSLDKYVTFDNYDRKNGNKCTYFTSISNYPSIIKSDNTKLSIIEVLRLNFNSEYEFKCYNKDNDNIITALNIDKKDLIGFNDFSVYTYSKTNYLENACVVMIKKPENIQYNENSTDNNILCISNKNIDEDVFGGYCPKSVSAYCNYEDGVGYASYMFSINKKLSHGESITIKCDNESYNFIAEEYIQRKITDISIIDNPYKDNIIEKINNETETYIKVKVSSDNTYDIYIDNDDIYISNEIINGYDGDFYIILSDSSYDDIIVSLYVEKDNITNNFVSNRFSCTGNIIETASCLCDCINNISNVPFVAKNVGSIVTIQHSTAGEMYNNKCSIEFSDSIIYNDKVIKYSLNGDNFSGGTDDDGCRFRIHSDDIIQFIGESDDRYIKTQNGDNAKIISYSYLIDEYGDIDEDDYIISTDENGKNIKISDVKQVEIVDKFYPKVGLLSFYPIKDFDFDTIYSQYCDNNAFNDEVEEFANTTSRSNLKQFYLDNLKFERLHRSDNSSMISEYDYYYENLLPSLCTISKTTPYISKWGYVDGLDSCENPYRLNCSKIFGVNNFSSNLFLIDGSMADYTHEMPYYLYDDFNLLSVYDDDSDTYCIIDDSDDDYISNIINNNIYSIADISDNNEYQYIYHLYGGLADGENDKMRNYNKCVNYWKTMFERTDINMFENIMEIRENLSNRTKRNDKKYSRFKYGSSKKNSETLFRGVKFEVVNLVSNKNNVYKEVYSNKYNDYKFSFLMIPISDPDTLYFNNKVYFIKNDTFKFIVGFIICNMFNNDTFNKSYIYAGCLGLMSNNNKVGDISGLDISKTSEYVYEYSNNDGNVTVDNLTINDYAFVLGRILRYGYNENYSFTLSNGKTYKINDIRRGFNIYKHCTLTMNFEDAFGYDSYLNTIYISELEVKSSIIRLILSNLYKKFGNCIIDNLKITTSDYKNNASMSNYVSFDENDITISDKYDKIYIHNTLKGDRIIKDYDDETIYIIIDFKISVNLNYINIPDSGNIIVTNDNITLTTVNGERNINEELDTDISNSIYSNIYDMYNNISAYNIKENINKGYNVDYNSDNFKIKIIEPVSINTYDIFENKTVSSKLSIHKIIESVDIGMKDNINNIGIKILNRYSGYYEPIFKDIIFYDDLEVFDKYTNKKYIYKFTNVSFDTEYSDNQGSFGIINNMFFHKINEENKSIITSLTPYYPLIGEYALDYRDYNIFSSNWDANYYTKQKDISASEELDYIAIIENGISMFGSKYMNVPESVYIDSLIGAEELNEDYLNSQIDFDSEVMYEEVNSENVEYYLFLKKRIIRYFSELEDIQTEFDKWINQEESKDYGIKGNIEDDILEYVEQNIIKLYEISDIHLFVKKIKRGINDENIENDYEAYFNKNWSKEELLNLGFEEVKSFSINDINSNDFDKKITYKLSTGMQEYFAFSFTITKK